MSFCGNFSLLLIILGVCLAINAVSIVILCLFLVVLWLLVILWLFSSCCRYTVTVVLLKHASLICEPPLSCPPAAAVWFSTMTSKRTRGKKEILSLTGGDCVASHVSAYRKFHAWLHHCAWFLLKNCLLHLFSAGKSIFCIDILMIFLIVLSSIHFLLCALSV